MGTRRKKIEDDGQKPGEGFKALGSNESLLALVGRLPEKAEETVIDTNEPKKETKMPTAREEGADKGITVVKTGETQTTGDSKKKTKKKTRKGKKASKVTNFVKLTEDEAAKVVKRAQVAGVFGTFTISERVELKIDREGFAIRQDGQFVVRFERRMVRELVMAIATIYQGFDDEEQVENVTVNKDGIWTVITITETSAKASAPKKAQSKEEVEADEIGRSLLSAPVMPMTPLLPNTVTLERQIEDDRNTDARYAATIKVIVINALFSFLADGGETIGVELTKAMMVKDAGQDEVNAVERFPFGVPCVGTDSESGFNAEAVYKAWNAAIGQEDHPLHCVSEFPSGNHRIDFYQMPTKVVEGTRYILPLPFEVTSLGLLERAREVRDKEVAEAEQRERFDESARARAKEEEAGRQWGEENLRALFTSGNHKGGKKMKEGCFHDDGTYNFRVIGEMFVRHCSVDSEECVEHRGRIAVIGDWAFMFCSFHGVAAVDVRIKLEDDKRRDMEAAKEEEFVSLKTELQRNPALFLAHDLTDGRRFMDLSDHLSQGGDRQRVPRIEFRGMNGDGIDPVSGEVVEGAKGFLIFVPPEKSVSRRVDLAGYRPVSRSTFEIVREHLVDLPENHYMVGIWEMVDFVRTFFAKKVKRSTPRDAILGNGQEEHQTRPRKKSSGGATNKRRQPKVSVDEKKKTHEQKVAKPGYGAAKRTKPRPKKDKRGGSDNGNSDKNK